MLIRICAWCKAYMGITHDSTCDTRRVTHGICRQCYQEWWQGVQTRLLNLNRKERGQDKQR